MTHPKRQMSDRIRMAIRELRAKSGGQHIRAGQVLELLEKRGIEITPSVRAMTSRNLHRAGEFLELRENAPNVKPKMGPKEISSAFAAGQKRAKLAAELLEACDGDHLLAKLELDRLR
jgi:hypothetical protein